MIEEAMYGDSKVYLKFIPAEEYNKMKNVIASSVHGFPIKDDEILFTVNHRGIDIIGGHIEKGESPEMALIRESAEEASIRPISFKLIGAIEVDNRDNPNAIAQGYPEKGYQLFYAITTFDTYKFEATHECTERRYIKASDVAQTHHKWLNTHEQVFEKMKTMVNLKPKIKSKYNS
jgi:8-oxo-dGTP diphosphatase